MSRLFENYERELTAATRDVSRGISGIGSAQGEARKQKIRAVETRLDTCDQILSQMDAEMRTLPPAAKARLAGRYRQYQQDVRALRRDLGASATRAGTAQSNRDSLFAGGSGGDPNDSREKDQRQRMLDNYDRINRSGDRLQSTHKLALETEQIGADTLGTLHQQRNQIVRMHDTLHEADDNLSKGRRLAQSMGRRQITNRVILALIIVLLLGVIGVIVYFKLIKPATSSPSPSPSTATTLAPTASPAGRTPDAAPLRLDNTASTAWKTLTSAVDAFSRRYRR